MSQAQRQVSIARHMRHWKTENILHEPQHPSLAADTKSFDEMFSLGRHMEELTRDLLEELFPYACILPHCDTTLGTRKAGKRAWIGGQELILPDFEIDTGDGLAFCLDIKGKQSHSFYHIDQDVQQFIDGPPLEDYRAYAAMRHLPMLILFHLWPNQVMHNYGLGEIARIHTGVGRQSLPDDEKEILVNRYPVNDAYYLVNADQFSLRGREGLNNGKPGYYLSTRHMYQGHESGTLPTLEHWEKACAPVISPRQGAQPWVRI